MYACVYERLRLYCVFFCVCTVLKKHSQHPARPIPNRSNGRPISAWPQRHDPAEHLNHDPHRQVWPAPLKPCTYPTPTPLKIHTSFTSLSSSLPIHSIPPLCPITSIRSGGGAGSATRTTGTPSSARQDDEEELALHITLQHLLIDKSDISALLRPLPPVAASHTNIACSVHSTPLARRPPNPMGTAPEARGRRRSHNPPTADAG